MGCTLPVLLILVSWMTVAVYSEIVNLPGKEQTTLYRAAHSACQYKMKTEPPYASDEPYCNRTWDGVTCWPDTPAGTIGTQACVNYIHSFNTEKNAIRICLSTGEWFFNPDQNKTWTNFTECYNHKPAPTMYPTPPMHIVKHIGNIVLIYNLGYGVSLAFLVLAVFIMTYFRKLHCQRNTIHVNLFVSFILRAAISFMKQNLLVQSVGLPKDIYYDNDGRIHFQPEGTHWECKLLFTVFQYILGANYMWVFVEGLYLYTLIYIAVFSEKRALRWYILFGWGSPLIFVLPWVMVRIFLEDELCWNTHPTRGYFWIMKGPIVLSIVVNFIFFLFIVWALFTKLKTSSRLECRQFRYRRLAKSTAFLIPLFGAYYILFICIPENSDLELAELYAESILSSFQGFIVALLFCFLNGEVQSELRKKWGFGGLARRRNSARSGTMSTIARGSTVMSVSMNEDAVPSSRLCPRLVETADDGLHIDSMEMMQDISLTDSNGHAHTNHDVNAHAPNGHVEFARDGHDENEEEKPMLTLEVTNSDRETNA